MLHSSPIATDSVTVVTAPIAPDDGVQKTPSLSTAKRTEFLPVLALVRCVAALIVVYDHLVGIWLQRQHLTWKPADFADRWIFDPLHIMEHGGPFAVAMFFLVSGFVIVLVAQRESLRVFAIRRLLRIFPPFWASTLLLLAVYGVVLLWSPDPVLRGYAVQEVLTQPNAAVNVATSLTLANFLLGTPPVNGVAWTLIIEVLFYLMVASMLPLLKRHPRIALCVAFSVLALVQIYARTNSFVFLLAANLVYVAYLFLGTLIFFRWSGQIGNRSLVVGTLAFAGLFLLGVRNIVLQPPFEFSGYGVSYSAAWLAFVILLLLNDKLRLSRVSDFFSRISYSLYLNHGGMGLLALTLLYPWLGYTASLLITFVLVVAISVASYRWIELPSQRLGRKLTAS